MLQRCMTKISSQIPTPPLAAVLALLALASLLVGAGMAGWLDHGASIFLAMASNAWAYCF
jgi:hypothetical protein